MSSLSVTSKVKYKGDLKDLYAKSKDKGTDKPKYEIKDWKILDVPTSKYNNAFVRCPNCGSSFSNVLWIPLGADHGELKCTKCKITQPIDLSDEDDPSVNVVQDIKIKVKKIKEDDPVKYPPPT